MEDFLLVSEEVIAVFWSSKYLYYNIQHKNSQKYRLPPLSGPPESPLIRFLMQKCHIISGVL